MMFFVWVAAWIGMLAVLATVLDTITVVLRVRAARRQGEHPSVGLTAAQARIETDHRHDADPEATVIDPGVFGRGAAMTRAPGCPVLITICGRLLPCMIHDMEKPGSCANRTGFPSASGGADNPASVIQHPTWGLSCTRTEHHD